MSSRQTATALRGEQKQSLFAKLSGPLIGSASSSKYTQLSDLEDLPGSPKYGKLV